MGGPAAKKRKLEDGFSDSRRSKHLNTQFQPSFTEVLEKLNKETDSRSGV